MIKETCVSGLSQTRTLSPPFGFVSLMDCRLCCCSVSEPLLTFSEAGDFGVKLVVESALGASSDPQAPPIVRSLFWTDV